MCVLVRLLENELQRVQKSSEQKEKELRLQLEELKKDNDRQQKLIGQVVYYPCSISQGILFFHSFNWLSLMFPKHVIDIHQGECS